MKHWKDSVWFGLGAGILAPGMLAIFASMLIHQVKALAGADLLFIGCISVNILILKFLLNRHWEKSAKGVVSATFICAFIFYYYKVF